MIEFLNDSDRKYIMNFLESNYELENIQCENLGIPGDGYIYHMVDENQNRDNEFKKQKNL